MDLNNYRRVYKTDEEYYKHQAKKAKSYPFHSEPWAGKKNHIAHVKRFLKYLRGAGWKKDVRILDAGSRDGSALKIMADNGFKNTIGIDICDRHFEIAKSWGVKVIFGDINKLEFSDNEFGGVLCYYTLEHDPYPEKAISEFIRVLKPNGILYLVIHTVMSSEYHRFQFTEENFKYLISPYPLETLHFKVYKRNGRPRIEYIGKVKE